MKVGESNKSLKDLEIPFVEVNDWTKSELVQLIKYNNPQTFDSKLIPALWWPYWKARINEAL